MAAHLTGDGKNVFQVGGTVLSWRCTNRDQDDACAPNGSRDVGGESEPAFFLIPPNHRLEARLVDRDLILLQTSDLLGIDVHTGDIVTGLGQTCASDQTHVPTSYDRNVHFRPLSVLRCEYRRPAWRALDHSIVHGAMIGDHHDAVRRRHRLRRELDRPELLAVLAEARHVGIKIGDPSPLPFEQPDDIERRTLPDILDVPLVSHPQDQHRCSLGLLFPGR